MKLPKKNLSTFSTFNISLFIIAFLCISVTHSYGKAINKCFAEKYNFSCGDPYTFLLKNGIDTDQDIIKISDLQLYKRKPAGNCHGGVYRDAQQTTYYIKKSSPFTEFIGSKLMNLILGTTCTPHVKLIRDKKYHTASLELPKYQTQKKVDTTNKNILGEADLAIAMDFIGLVDRNSRNMGYVILNSTTVLAARVDFDFSFDFESGHLGEYSLPSTIDHLNLKHLYFSIQKYPKKQVIHAIKKVINIPDEELVFIFFQSWVTFTRAGYSLDLKPYLDLAYLLIERKNAFREALKNKNSVAYKLIEENHIAHKTLKKKHTKKRHRKNH